MNLKTTRTYIQNNNFKDLNFSEGEDMNELDLDITESRTTTFFAGDTEEVMEMYESYYIPIADLATSEINFDGRNGQFRIGNNLPNSL